MNIFAKSSSWAKAAKHMGMTIEAVQQAVAETKTEGGQETRGSPAKVLYNKGDGKNGWGKEYGTAQQALNDAIKGTDEILWDELNNEIVSGGTISPITNAIIAVQQDVRQDTITPIQGAKLLSEAYSKNGVKGLESIFNHAKGNLYPQYLERAKTYSTEVGKASRDLGGKVAKYLSTNQVGKNNREYLYHQLINIYSGISDGYADGIAIANGKTVYIVDSGRDNGKLDFGVRRKKTISDAQLRDDFVRSTNNDTVSEGNVSDELLEKFRYEVGSDSGLNLRRESGSKLQADTGKSQNQQSGVSGEDADQRGLTKGKALRKPNLIDNINELAGEESDAELTKSQKVAKVRGDLERMNVGSGEIMQLQSVPDKLCEVYGGESSISEFR